MDAADQYIARLAIKNTPKGGSAGGGSSLPAFHVEPPQSSSLCEKPKKSAGADDADDGCQQQQQPNFMHDPCTVLLIDEQQPSGMPAVGNSSNQSNADNSEQQQQHSSSSPSLLLGVNNEQRQPQQQSQQQQRKASLMPPLTEEDLRTTGMGHRDPESVAQLFGQDFASRFCLGPLLLPHEIRDCSVPRGVPTVKMRRRSNTQTADSPPPTTTTTASFTSQNAVESIVPLTPVMSKYPSLPSCAAPPIVARSPSPQNNNFANAFHPSHPLALFNNNAAAANLHHHYPQQHPLLFAMPHHHNLPPLPPSSHPLSSSIAMMAAPSPPAAAFGRISPQGWLPTASAAYFVPGVVFPRPTPFPVQFRWMADGQMQMAPFQRPGPGEFYPSMDSQQSNKDMAASHPDLFKFQLALDGWIKRQCKTRGSALLLSSLEMNSTFCQVCGGRLLEQSIQLGDADFLSNLLNSSSSSAAADKEAAQRRSRRSDGGMGLDEVEVICDEEQMIRIGNNTTAAVEADAKDNKRRRSENAKAAHEADDDDDGGGRASKELMLMDEEEEEQETTMTATAAEGGEGGSGNNDGPVWRAVETLEEPVRHALDPLLALFNRKSSGGSTHRITNDEDDVDGQQQKPPLLLSIPPPALPLACFSLVGLRSHSGGFRAGLLLAHQSAASRHEELQLLAPHVGMLSTLMTLMHNIEEQRRLAQQSQVFLSMTQNVFSSLQDMNQLVRNITKEAKALVQAEICSLFLLDKEHAELVAEVFEKNGTTEEYLTEIRMPLSQGIVGHVASTGLMMNVKDVYNHPFFYPKVDERTGFKTRNILCFPIKDSAGNLVGVAELCNKIGRDAFTRHDEQIAATFAVYCAISLSHCLLYRKLQEAHRRSHMAAELLVQGSTLSIAPEDILRLTVRDIPPPRSFHPEFDQLQFIPRSIGSGDIYVEASLAMFKECGFIERFRLRRRTLARFLLMVQKGYRDVPYHNWGHAFAVAHFCYLLLGFPMVRSALNELERFALLVACLCHDIDHRGTTNAFQLQSKTPLAQLYSSEGSVLERHHFAQTVTILGMDECNIFEQLNRQQYVEVLDCIREIILATDIAAHLRKVDRIRQMAEGGFKAGNAEHRYLFMCLLMTASDLSDQSKDFRHSKAIAENIYKEFFSQGDLEKQMGNRPIEMMDRERACVPKIQIEFMDTVALPVFKYLADLLPELRCTQSAILTNRRCWLALDQILQEQGLPTGGLDYLRNHGLEEKVMARVEPVEEEKQQQSGKAEEKKVVVAVGTEMADVTSRMATAANEHREPNDQKQQQAKQGTTS